MSRHLYIEFEKIEKNEPAAGVMPPARSAYASPDLRRNSRPFDYPEPGLPRGQFAQMLLDVGALIFFLFFVCALAASVPLAAFALLFVTIPALSG